MHWLRSVRCSTELRTTQKHGVYFIRCFCHAGSLTAMIRYNLIVSVKCEIPTRPSIAVYAFS